MPDAWAEAQALWSAWPHLNVVRPTDSTVIRLHDALRGLAADQADWHDVAALTRQVLLEQHARRQGIWPLRVPVSARLPSREQWENTKCDALTMPEGLSLTPRHWHPRTGFPPADQAAETELAEVYAGGAAVTSAYPADPFWTRALGPGYRHYTSLGQREAARTIVTAPPGSTVIVCLPTGQGKTELAWAAAIPATRQRGVAVVVVPTVVLAMDMERRVRRLLATLGEPPNPSGHYAYTGGLPDDVKQAIRRDIREGRQRVVITAPEALMGGLRPALESAVRQGLLTHLVIDEAHLVEQWGTEFRPEFQAMSGQRRSWLEMAPPGREPVTLAMSATLTRQQVGTLGELFGTPGATELIWAAQTRREPSYFVQQCDSVAARTAAVLEAVSALPKPMIVYATRKHDVAEWAQRLNRAGFRRLAVVTGDVDDAGRRAAIMGWRGEGADGQPEPTRYDIVIGTSAFGLGLDMSNVRSVIHACVPETLDRYYQEVGRVGRDRRPAVAYLASAPSDYDVARRINREIVISSDKGWDRWGSMVRSATDLGHGLLDIDLDTLPTYIPEESGHNRQWNVRTLNLMVQAKLIGLQAPQPPTRRTDEPEDHWQHRLQEHFARSAARVVASIRDGRTNDRTFWTDTIERQRANVATEQLNALERLCHLIKGDRCVGEAVGDYYRLPWRGGILRTTVNCRGCPNCRNTGSGRDRGALYRDGGEPLPGMAHWSGQADPLREFRGDAAWMSLWWRDSEARDNLLSQFLALFGRRGRLIIAGPGVDAPLAARVQRQAWPKPVVVDGDDHLTDSFPGPVVWVAADASPLPSAVRARLAADVPTYLVHPLDLPDPQRPHQRLSQSCDVSMPLTTVLRDL
ncbi:Helicase conserved C-terminal domain-containing protein [Micromonospora haikouensis]|uniref:DNA 3'-5' helicase n=1 Tax=Micromonospora haikouensis TaxID=686309 RepID=A0A1C4YJZ3_9ACTN|nr:protein DpdF [Micromonospora haikouensis]SCF20980.1 Helicase conserved C-terminal domain-containing protein [Micromonospora haikouensis]